MAGIGSLPDIAKIHAVRRQIGLGRDRADDS
jgi:hypothetical protein